MEEIIIPREKPGAEAWLAGSSGLKRVVTGVFPKR